MLRLALADGRAVYFRGGATLTRGFYGQLVTNPGGTYTLTFPDGRVHQFSAQGKLTALIDRNNNQTTLSYDAQGRLTTITDPFGRTLNVTPNADGRVEQISDGLGVVATYSYGPNDALETVNYPDGSLYQFSYIMQGSGSTARLLLTEVRDALGNILEKHEYDSQGRAITSEKHNGVEKYTFTYTSPTQTDVVDALGRTSKFFFRNIGGRNVVERVEGVCGCGGGGDQVRRWEYDDQLNVTREIDALNRPTTYTYDSQGNRLTKTNVLGTERWTYNAFGQPLTHIDLMEGETVWTYDDFGNLLTRRDPLNHTTTFTYTARGQLTTITDARRNTTTLTYDEQGRLTEVEDADDKTTAYDYDARARLTSITNALRHTTSFEYDAVNRLKKVTYPDQRFVTYNYDLAGRRTEMIDARNNTITYEYDPAYRLTKIIDPLTHETEFGYDAMSNRTSVTDAENHTTNYEYDDFNRLKKIIHPPAVTGAARLEERFEYDAVGNLKKRIDTAQRETRYDYDDAHRLSKITDTDSRETHFGYNARSQMTIVVDALGQQYGFSYDPFGRVLTQTRAGKMMVYEYDGVGNRTKRTDYNGAETDYDYDALNRLQTVRYPNASENITLTYDALSQLKMATNQHGAVTFDYNNRNQLESATDVFDQRIGYRYDANGNRESVSLNSANYANYIHDPANRLTRITAASDGAQINFGYDDADKLTSRAYPNGITTAYTYDGMSRLTRLMDARGASLMFDRHLSYNIANQIAQIAEPSQTRNFGYDVVNRLTGVTNPTAGNESYAYDAVGNRTGSHLAESYTHEPFNRLTSTGTATFVYDDNGNMTSRTDAGGTWQYEWDYENRLKKVTRPDGEYVVYKYDALGRRIERAPSSGASTKFTYDGQDVVLDDNSDGTTVSYLNGLGIDNKLRQAVNGQAQYYLADHLGSTNGLTDAQGNLIAQTTYDSFGNPTGSLPTRYRFTGRERDEFTGLMYYRARWYSPELGRFISEDPIGFEGGNNFYEYVDNNPVNEVDPLGLKGKPRRGAKRKHHSPGDAPPAFLPYLGPSSFGPNEHIYTPPQPHQADQPSDKCECVEMHEPELHGPFELWEREMTGVGVGAAMEYGGHLLEKSGARYAGGLGAVGGELTSVGMRVLELGPHLYYTLNVIDCRNRKINEVLRELNQIP